MNRPSGRIIVKLIKTKKKRKETHTKDGRKEGARKRADRRKGVKEPDQGRRVIGVELGGGREGGGVGLTSPFGHECVYFHKRSQQLESNLESRFFPKGKIKQRNIFMQIQCVRKCMAFIICWPWKPISTLLLGIVPSSLDYPISLISSSQKWGYYPSIYSICLKSLEYTM